MHTINITEERTNMKTGKILIKAIIRIQSGLHIGGDTAFSAIGAVDNPVIKNRLDNRPIIPGSSLKGKMRSLLSKSLLNGKDVKVEDDPDEVNRLFGSSNKKIKSGLQFFDCVMTEDSAKKLENLGGITEVKFENTIDREKGTAKDPRQIERVIAGAEFIFNLVYNINDFEKIESDFLNIVQCFKLIASDYLGGGGTRGNGRIVFDDIEINDGGNIEKAQSQKLLAMLQEAAQYGKSLWSWHGNSIN